MYWGWLGLKIYIFHNSFKKANENLYMFFAKKNNKFSLCCLGKETPFSSIKERSQTPSSSVSKTESPSEISQSNQIDCITSWFKRGWFLNSATICKGEFWNHSNLKYWNAFSILRGRILQALHWKKMGWKLFKILSAGSWNFLTALANGKCITSNMRVIKHP